MKSSHLIARQFEKVGTPVYITEGSWNSTPFNAVLSFLWRKKSSDFEKRQTPIGAVPSEYYYYLGPANHDILSLSDEAVLICAGRKFVFVKKDAVTIGDEVSYYSGVLRLVREAEYEEY